MFPPDVTYAACHVKFTIGAIFVGKAQLCTMVGVAGKILVISQISEHQIYARTLLWRCIMDVDDVRFRRYTRISSVMLREVFDKR